MFICQVVAAKNFTHYYFDHIFYNWLPIEDNSNNIFSDYHCQIVTSLILSFTVVKLNL